MLRILRRLTLSSNGLLFALGIACVICMPGISDAQSDNDLWSLIEKAGGTDDYDGAAWVMILDRTDVDVEDSGLAHTRHHTLRKILSDDGVLQQAVQRFNYDAASNFIRLESVRIFRKDKTVEEVDASLARDLYAPAYMIYWGARMKLLGLPRLAVGDAVEIKTYKKGFEIASKNLTLAKFYIDWVEHKPE